MAKSHGTLPPHLVLRHASSLESLRLPGLDGNGNTKHYVPYHELRRYWDPNTIREVLKYYNDLPSVDIISDRYLRVFSTLVYIDKVAYLSGFTTKNLNDEHWPSNEHDPQWPTDYAVFLEEFRSKQWMFFPLQFRRTGFDGRHLPADHILPIETSHAVDPSRPNGNTKTLRITLNRQCNDLGDPSTNTFFLKTYQLGNGPSHRAYIREKEVYTVIEASGPSRHVARYYGSFKHHNTGNLVLEYVEGGTLRNYIDKELPPQTPEDIHDFWTSIAGLTEGLRKLHQADDVSSSHRQRKVIIHQDLTLSNMLVVRDPQSQSPYKFVLKLVDFGLSSTPTTTALDDGDDDDAEKVWARDNQGTKTFAAPENDHHDPERDNGPNRVTRATDVWALGCSYFQLGAWVTGGMSSIETFREMRVEELSNQKGFIETGYGQTFQNGSGKLRAVDDAYKLFYALAQENNDEITPKMLEIAHSHMLENEPHKRLTAKQLQGSVGSALEKLKPEAGCSDSKHCITIGRRAKKLPEDGKKTPNTRMQELTVDDCVKLRRDTRAKTRQDAAVMSVIQTLKKRLPGRDYLFLIDNSPSMSKHLAEVVHTFTGLATVARHLDRNGIELAFLSSPETMYRRRPFLYHTGGLMELVEGIKYDHDPALTEHNLGLFIDKAITPKLPDRTGLRSAMGWSTSKAVTLFILTDGAWGVGHAEAAGVQNPINELIKTMSERRAHRPEVAIQFVRVGNDPDGIRYLQYLDDKMPMDIVDTRSIDDNVFLMFMASISKEYDDKT